MTLFRIVGGSVTPFVTKFTELSGSPVAHYSSKYYDVDGLYNLPTSSNIDASQLTKKATDHVHERR